MKEFPGLRGILQPVPELGYRDGFGWEATVELEIPLDWPSGVYIAPSPPPRGRGRSSSSSARLGPPPPSSSPSRPIPTRRITRWVDGASSPISPRITPTPIW